MIEAVLSWCVGLLLGVVFAVLSLPIPAPAHWAGVLGIIGILCGATIVAAARR